MKVRCTEDKCDAQVDPHALTRVDDERGCIPETHTRGSERKGKACNARERNSLLLRLSSESDENYRAPQRCQLLLQTSTSLALEKGVSLAKNSVYNHVAILQIVVGLRSS
jgi:hypothetical protein